jgi:monoamine oxidase
MRTPIVVAWVGGPPASAIDDEARTVIRARALRALRDMGAKRATIHDAWLHDWRHDPFARGAYAFPLVGGASAGVALARAVEDTLFFAGEATSEDYAGTVEGAIETGQRAAERVLRSLGRR